MTERVLVWEGGEGGDAYRLVRENGGFVFEIDTYYSVEARLVLSSESVLSLRDALNDLEGKA